MINKNISKLLIAFALAFLLMPGVLYAAFAPSAITIDDASTGSEPQAIPVGTLDAVITPTTADTADYTINKYVYVWNNSDEALDDDALGVDSSFVPDGATIVISTVSEDQFGNSDGDAWYLHVKTVYWSAAGGTELSDDTITEAYTFDNVAPVADISLDESVDGQTTTTTSVSPVWILVIGDYGDIATIYVNTSANFSTADRYDFSNSSTTTLTYSVDGTGSKTLYAWFEDALGNRSDSTPLTFEVLAGKFMEPAGVQNLEVDGTITFGITGAGDSETFDWSILTTSGAVSNAASFELGADQDASTFTITGVTEGDTIKVVATPTTGSAYESGEISIVSTAAAFDYDVDKNGKADALTDGLLIIRYLFNIKGSNLINSAVANDATVKDSATIEAYLEAAKTDPAFDVDDNGKADALTDGLLIIRYLFNIKGPNLINSAVANEAQRVGSDEVQAFMDQYIPE
jgi:hypothetical protein